MKTKIISILIGVLTGILLVSYGIFVDRALHARNTAWESFERGLEIGVVPVGCKDMVWALGRPYRRPVSLGGKP